MPFHTGGFFEDIDAAGAFVNIAAITDDRLLTDGDNLRVPSLNHIIAIAAGADGVVDPRFRLDSPTLDQLTRLEVTPINTQNAAAVEPDNPQKVMDLRNNPVMLGVDELLTCQLNNNPAAAQDQWCVLWFSDGPVQRVTNQRIFTARLTGSTTLTANVFTDVVPTLDENLPPGRYSIVGMRPLSAGCVFARVILREGSFWRPGALGVDLNTDIQHEMFRHGGLGIWGEFPFTQLPNFEFFSVVGDTAESVHLDLIKVS